MKLRAVPSDSGNTDDQDTTTVQLNNDSAKAGSTINPLSSSTATTVDDTTKTPRPESRPTVGVTANDDGREFEEYVDISTDHSPGSVRGSGGSCAGSQAASTTTLTSNLTSKTPPIRCYGHDLSPLTLGRIEDGFRRDRYVFPVDLKGRGEGRAVEARAVMQVQHTTGFSDLLSSVLTVVSKRREKLSGATPRNSHGTNRSVRATSE